MADLSTFPITKKWPAKNPDIIQLYSLPTPNGVKVSIALEELGLAYEAHRVDFGANEQKSEAFESLNPNGRIPALIDPHGPDGKPIGLFESGAILWYLAEKTGKLIPADASGRYETLCWVMFQMGGVGPMFGQFGHFHKFAAEKVAKSMAAHGVSIVEVMKSGASYSVNRSSSFNRRITAATPMEISGPARGDDLMKTKYSPSGTQTRGTLNNCAHGCTPWGTYLTCEENWAGYFKRPAAADNPNRTAKEVTALTRYGVGSSNGSYGWANSTTPGDLYDRWNAVVSGAAAGEDYRNAANTMGWVVEIDPYDPVAAPRKRTALARFNHEGAWAAQAVPGKPIVYYMGDDARNDYIYKFVSSARWNPADADNGAEV